MHLGGATSSGHTCILPASPWVCLWLVSFPGWCSLWCRTVSPTEKCLSKTSWILYLWSSQGLENHFSLSVGRIQWPTVKSGQRSDVKWLHHFHICPKCLLGETGSFSCVVLITSALFLLPRTVRICGQKFPWALIKKHASSCLMGRLFLSPLQFPLLFCDWDAKSPGWENKLN
jgi:hypothetical protein